jgi:hypothetical protein
MCQSDSDPLKELFPKTVLFTYGTAGLWPDKTISPIVELRDCLKQTSWLCITKVDILQPFPAKNVAFVQLRMSWLNTLHIYHQNFNN